MLLRRALRCSPALLLFACDQGDLVGARVGMGGSGDTALAGDAGAPSGASSNAGGSSAGGSSAGGDASGSFTGGAVNSGAGSDSVLANGGAGGDSTSSGGAGQSDGGENTLGGGGTANGGTANGGSANGGTANGGSANGGTANGGSASGGSANGGTANGGTAGAGGAASACNGTEQRACYSGPADARGKGACKEGKQTCTDGQWGACTGDVQPVAEVCDDNVDNDCDGLKDDCGNFRCAVTLDTLDVGDYASPSEVARDSAGNSVITGGLRGSADFGGKKLTSSGNFDIFVAKYSPTCKLVWVETFGSPKIDRGVAVAVAANDDIIVGGIGGEFAFTGDTGADIDLGGGLLTHTGSGDAFLARYDKNGKHIWSHLYGSAGVTSTSGVAVAPNGDVVLSAYTGGNFGGGDLGNGSIVARYTSGGDYIWSKLLNYGTNNGINTQAYDVTVDAAGTVLVAGAYDAGKMYHNGVLEGGVNTAFLSSVAADGSKTNWTKSARTIYSPLALTTDDLNMAHAVVASGTNAIWAGQCVGPIDIGGGQVDGLGSWDAFVGGFDSVGNHQFSFLDGGPNADAANDIALDQQGNIGLVGQDWPLGVVVKYSSSGRFLWSHALDAPYLQRTAIATDNSMAVIGRFDTSANVGNGEQLPVGTTDGFLILYEP